MNAYARVAIVFAASTLLGGCVMFEVAPSDALGCDPALVGAWQGKADDGETQTLRLDTQCTLSGAGKDGQTETHPIRTLELGDQHYIVVEETEPAPVLDSEGKTVETWPASRVDLFRYRREGDTLRVWFADTAYAKALAAPGVTARSDARVDPKTGQQLESLVPSNILLRGKREDLAAALRAQGDALFYGLRLEKSLTLQRLPETASP